MKTIKNGKWIWIAIGIILLATVIFAAFIDIDTLIRIFKGVRWDFYLIGMLFLVMGIGLITVRWRFLLRNEPGFASTFHANSISYMLKLLLPVPQALIRLTALSFTSSIDIYLSAPMMMIERFLEMIMRLVAITLAGVLIFDFPLWIAGLLIAAILLLAIPAFVVWFTRNASSAVPRLISRFTKIPGLSKEKLRQAMLDFQTNISTMRATRGVSIAVGYSLVMWGSFLLYYVFGFLSLGIRLDNWEILAMSAAVLAILPPSTPAMIGVYQGVIVAILIPFGALDGNQATAYALLMFGGQLALWAILGVWGLKQTDININKLSQGKLNQE